MNIKIPTTEEIVSAYKDFNLDLSQEDRLEARKAELEALKKEDLVKIILDRETTQAKATVQELAKAILRDEELIAANYEQIADAIRQIMPGVSTSSKSIASYVSKKKDEWELPPRIRISR